MSGTAECGTGVGPGQFCGAELIQGEAGEGKAENSPEPSAVQEDPAVDSQHSEQDGALLHFTDGRPSDKRDYQTVGHGDVLAAEVAGDRVWVIAAREN